jgi:hypothetical protein
MKKAKMDSDDNLSLILPYSRSEVLARFEQTSKGTKIRVTQSMLEHNTIRNSSRLAYYAKISAGCVTKPNSSLLHFAEIKTCMICKEPYHGGYHPDFGVFVHSKCIKNMLVPVKTLVDDAYPIKDMLKQLPFTGNKNFLFLRDRLPGFPELCSVAEWDQNQNADAGMLEVFYRDGNSASVRIIKQIKSDAWDVMFMDAAVGTEFCMNISSAMKRVPTTLRKAIRTVFNEMKDMDEPPVTAVSYLQCVVELCALEPYELILAKIKRGRGEIIAEW